MKNFNGLSFGWTWKRLEEKCLNDARARGSPFWFHTARLGCIKGCFFFRIFMSAHMGIN